MLRVDGCEGLRGIRSPSHGYYKLYCIIVYPSLNAKRIHLNDAIIGPLKYFLMIY